MTVAVETMMLEAETRTSDGSVEVTGTGNGSVLTLLTSSSLLFVSKLMGIKSSNLIYI